MKFKIDENLPMEFAEVLRAAGHDGSTVLEQNLSGIRDEDLFAVCQAEDRVLMTLDLDFADIRLYPPAESPGVPVLRIQPQDKDRLLRCLHKILPLIEQESLAKRLWIVEVNRIRLRE